jgi:DNA transposition AAA+ family ATPase
MITDNEKESIRERLRAYVGKFQSQNMAAKSLKGTSAGTISTILNGGKDDSISEVMWRKIGAQVGGMPTHGEEWNVADTYAFREMTSVLEDAQLYKNVTWVTGEAGSGKSTTARQYQATHREAFYILCSEDLQRTDFVREIARAIGLRSDGITLRDLWDLIIVEIVKMESPVLIFDEADKLTETVFHYFVSMYNKIEDRCGMVFLSTDTIKQRIEIGLRYYRPGYKEFFSRIGRKYFDLSPADKNDVAAICMANGVTDEKSIVKVVADAADHANDFRRVKKFIHVMKRTTK